MHELAKKEDYKGAAAIRDEISSAQIDDEAHVLLANAELYAAFSTCDLERMKALWLPGPDVQCIHPFEKRSCGYSAVCSAWERLFEVAKARKSTISAEDVRVSVRGATATVVCLEQVVSKVLKRPLRSMLATNVFRKVGPQWLLFHRHVSTASKPDSFSGNGTLLSDETGDQESVDLFAKLASIPGAHMIIKQGDPSRGLVDEDEDLDDLDIPGAQIIHGAYDEGDDFRGIRPSSPSGMPGETSDSEEDEDDPEMFLEELPPVNEAARETVRALRRLSREGKLTNQAKVQLLSAMIQTPGESMPERAHQLLLSGVAEEEKQAAWGDFAELVAEEARRLTEGGAPTKRRRSRRRKSDAGDAGK